MPSLQSAFILPLSLQLGEQLKQLVPVSGLTVMDLEVEGTCMRFSPLMTAAGKRSPWGTLVLFGGHQCQVVRVWAVDGSLCSMRLSSLPGEAFPFHLSAFR